MHTYIQYPELAGDPQGSPSDALSVGKERESVSSALGVSGFVRLRDWQALLNFRCGRVKSFVFPLE